MSVKMKNILSFVSLGIIIFLAVGSTDDSSSTSTSSSSSSYSSPSVSSTPRIVKHWRSNAYITDLEKKKRAHVASNDIKPDSKMDFPYNWTTASISVVMDKNSTWAYMEFSSPPNIVNSQTEDGYTVIKANVYIDGVKETATMTQEWGSKVLFFRYPNWLIKKLKSCETFRVNLRWHGNPNVVWSFQGEGFNSEFEAMHNKFSNL